MILMTLIMADFLTSSKWPKRPLHDKNWLIIFNYERTNKQMMDDILEMEHQQIVLKTIYANVLFT